MSNTVIGLTGPTGAGKSTVAAVLRELGCAVVDADRVARDVSEQGGCHAALRQAFGSGIFRADGTIDRAALAALAFSSPENTRRLNEATHPPIVAECGRRLSEAKKGPFRAVVLDAPLLFESGADRLCDATVAVLASEASRLNRVTVRDGIPEDAVRLRMSAQQEPDYYRKRADYCFDGEVPRELLRSAVETLLGRILEGTHGKT